MKKPLLTLLIAFAAIFIGSNVASAAGSLIPIYGGGTGTSTAPVGQLLYGGATAYQSVGTTTATCSGSVSCTLFTIIGSSPVTITGTSASSTLLGDSNTFSGLNKFTNVGTTTFTGAISIGTTTPGSFFSVQGVANFVSGAISTIYNGLRVLVELAIPTSAAPTLTNLGDIAINTTTASSSLRFFDGLATRSLYPDKDSVFSFASSTLTYEGKFAAAGTTTILLGNYNRPITLVNFYCKTDTGSLLVRFGSGTASTTSMYCDSLGQEVGIPVAAALTNNTFTRRQNFKIDLGSATTTPNIITITADIRQDAD